jgi:quercetin dioxygenase-like cupin family protein
MTVELRRPEEVSGEESTPGIVRKPIFRTERTVMAKSHIESGTSTGWHHHGDRDAYGYLLEGGGTIEYGPGGRERHELHAPMFFHVPAGTVHRETITSDDDAVVVVNFVGEGPVAINVDGPETE